MVDCHVLLVTFPGQGHINPSLQFAKRLVRIGVKVTFSTSVSAILRTTKGTPTIEDLTFSPFYDGYDEGWQANGVDIECYMSDLTTRGSQAIGELITASANKGRPFRHVIYTTIIPWVGRTAERLSIPSTLLWIQPAAILDIYYYYFNGFFDSIEDNSIELPGLPRLTSSDLPSFLLPSNSNIYYFALPAMKEHIEILGEETCPKVLINTFDALEFDALRSIEKLNLIPVGPLLPSAFLDGRDPADTSFGGDLFQKSKDYIEWLNSKPNSSVIYVSFGSISRLSKQQMEEMAHGLLGTNKPFLWVIRATKQGEKQPHDLSCIEELEQKGLIVPWCSQVEVLSQPAVGCFVTHCGWNSSSESLVSGVPVVALPQWTDQATNAKLVQDVWKTGVRMKANEEGIVEGEEIKNCLEIVLGGGCKGEELRKNAKKWKDSAKDAVKEGGLSDINLKAFVESMVDGTKK